MNENNELTSAEKADKALRSIGQKHDAYIKGRKILVLNGKDIKAPKINDIGIKVWGAIDGMVKYHGFYFYFVDNFK